MKVKHVLMITAVLLSMLVVPVMAEGNSQDVLFSQPVGYEIIIPPTAIQLAKDTIVTAEAGVDITLPEPGAVIELSVSGERTGEFSLLHTYDGVTKLHYGIEVNGLTVPAVTGLILSAPADYAGEQTVQLNFSLIDEITTAGSYKDTLTFTAQPLTANVVTTAEGLAEAISQISPDEPGLIVLGADITGNLEVDQRSTSPNSDRQITIDGQGHEFSGLLTVDGGSSLSDSATLTIKNIHFTGKSPDNDDDTKDDAYIRLGDGTSDTRYTDGVVVQDCTFDGNGMVAIKSYTGGDKNLIIDGCTVSANMHSLAQLKNVEEGLQVINCHVYSKNGINLNNCESFEMSNCEFDVKGYAVRFGVSGTINTVQKFFSIKDCTLESTLDDPTDAVIMFRDSAKYSTVDLTGTTLIGTTPISGNVEGTTTLIGYP